MEWVTGKAFDGRHAWLLSARRGEWVLVDSLTHYKTKWSLRRQGWLLVLAGLMLYLGVSLGALYFLETDGMAVAALFVWLGPFVPVWWTRRWRRRLVASGERHRGAVSWQPSIPQAGKWIEALLLVLMGLCLFFFFASLGRARPAIILLTAGVTLNMLVVGVSMILQRRWLKRLAEVSPPPFDPAGSAGGSVQAADPHAR
ncbi:MAG: hypothetical protein Q8O14_08655 [bacterium]|jgi:hypothetical protein|nr:hypothetical protein [bacterium]